MILFHFVNCPSLSFNYLVILRGESLGNGKSTERFFEKIDKKLNITLYLILFKYISHLSELEFFFLCDCTNQKWKTIERCVKERLEQVVRVQLWRDFRTRECSRVIIQMFHANYLKHLKD